MPATIRKICLPLIACFGLLACDDESAPAQLDAGPREQPDSAQGDAGGGPESSVYALSTLVWGDVETTGYVTLLDTLDVPEDLKLDQAREFPGYASIAAADGKLLVTTNETSVVERFAISDDLQWQDSGSLSLINEGVTNSGFFRQYMQRDRMAYAEIHLGQRALWDVSALEIKGSALDTQLELTRDGLDLFANFNRSYFSFDDAVMRPFSYHDQDWFRWADDSLIVVYDPDTHEEKSVIEAPCPGLDTITKDEQGRLYFSNWEYPALHALAGSGAAPCVVRVTPDGELDSSWDLDLMALTEGRQIMNFRYLRDGKAIAAVLHAEKFGADFDFAAELSDQQAFWDAYALNYRLWLFDLSAGTAQPVSGLADEDFPPSYSHSQIDGRTFILLEATDFSETVVFELTDEGELKRHFSVTGSAYQWLKVR